MDRIWGRRRFDSDRVCDMGVAQRSEAGYWELDMESAGLLGLLACRRRHDSACRAVLEFFTVMVTLGRCRCNFRGLCDLGVAARGLAAAHFRSQGKNAALESDLSRCLSGPLHSGDSLRCGDSLASGTPVAHAGASQRTNL